MRNGEHKASRKVSKSETAVVALREPPLLFFQTPQQPLSATSEYTAASGNTRSGASERGC